MSRLERVGAAVVSDGGEGEVKPHAQSRAGNQGRDHADLKRKRAITVANASASAHGSRERVATYPKPVARNGRSFRKPRALKRRVPGSPDEQQARPECLRREPHRSRVPSHR
jgi:hypothetical protein